MKTRPFTSTPGETEPSRGLLPLTGSAVRASHAGPVVELTKLYAPKRDQTSTGVINRHERRVYFEALRDYGRGIVGPNACSGPLLSKPSRASAMWALHTG